MNNTNVLCAVNGVLKKPKSSGGVRETVFLHPACDFFVDDTYCIEVGGKEDR